MSLKPVVYAQDLSRSFAGRKALDKLNLSLPEGSFLAVFGPNGAGKSTLLRILSTLDKPSSGQLELFGQPLKDNAEQLRARIGLIAHNPLLYASMTVEENLLFFARLYGVPEPRQRALELLKLVGLAHRRHDVLRGFSRGMTQRVSIARALLHNPELILMDEPYAGLDARACQLLDSILEQIRSEESHSFIMVSHDLEHGLSLASHALLLCKGKNSSFLCLDEDARSFGRDGDISAAGNGRDGDEGDARDCDLAAGGGGLAGGSAAGGGRDDEPRAAFIQAYHQAMNSGVA